MRQVINDRYEIGDQGPVMSLNDRHEIGWADGVQGDRAEIGGPLVEVEGEEEGFPYNISLGAAASVPVSDPALAVKAVVQTARDARQPAPKMVAVPAEAPPSEDLDESDEISAWFSDIAVDTGVLIGGEGSGVNPFPIMTKLLTRFGAGQERPRYVRVDTEESYQQFCSDHSPEMAEMKEHLAVLADKFEEHVHDPHAHESHEEVLDAIDEAEAVGAEAVETEKSKEIEMWLPEWARGNVRAWREGDFICASVKLPGADGEVRVCTSMTPVVRAIEEIEQHAAAANVSAAAVVGVLPAMGCCLGAGDLVKTIAAAAPSLLARPEATGKQPWVCRVEPAASPTLCALFALLCECGKGTNGACAEWDGLADAAGRNAPYVAKAMTEARDLFLQARKAKRK